MRDSPKFRRYAAALAGLAVITNVMTQAMGGDEALDGISDFDREKNIMLYNPYANNFLAIPLPQGIDAIGYIGHLSYDYLTDRIDNTQLLKKLAAKAGQFVSPIGEASGPLQYIAPTMVKPFVQIYENTNYNGNPIYYQNKYNPDANFVQSETGFAKTEEAYKTMAKTMNILGGGGRSETSWLDMHPETYRHYARWITGGSGQFMARIYRGAYSSLTGGGIPELKEIPIVRSFLKEPEPRYRYRNDIYDMVNNSEVKVYDDEQLDRWNDIASYLMARDELSPDQYYKLASKLDKNQNILNMARNKDMSFEEAKNYLKGMRDIEGGRGARPKPRNTRATDVRGGRSGTVKPRM